MEPEIPKKIFFRMSGSINIHIISQYREWRSKQTHEAIFNYYSLIWLIFLPEEQMLQHKDQTINWERKRNMNKQNEIKADDISMYG